MPTASIASLLALAVMLALAIVTALAGMSLQGTQPTSPDGVDAGPSALARGTIPIGYLRLYEMAARRYGIDWAVLAAIGRVECDHGLDADPSCGSEGATNYAGAGGPMQFIASTWTRYGIDGDGDGRADRWDPADAIYGAANYLAHAGAPRDYRRAILAYNHAGWYADDVEAWAARYRGSVRESALDAPLSSVGAGREAMPSGGAPDARLQAETTTMVRFTPGSQALLPSWNGHQALIPAQAPAAVQAMIVAGNELQELPYGPGGHPDPRGAFEEDCSSTVNYVLYRAGVRPINEIVHENPLAQDYMRWGLPGPGRWVTIYATTSPSDHVFIAIAGLRLDTSHDGSDVGPNGGEDGPRWRVFDRIPGWAHWSVRHPPGF
ncbi:MAG TPA: lytic transglycosylase domain-containing protein [Solirubrobacteraceae bacterium]|nr:lytic transglycosylase domain-containing protein [Solirubrobacteraceae bacterium]